jgi:sulfide:quinone oxidoreductase
MVSAHHEVLIVGGGTAGITVAARLRRKGETDVAVVEPSDRHFYQPLYTLVGAGAAPISATVRPMGSVIPKGVTWIRDAVEAFDPVEQTVTTRDGAIVAYDHLVVAPGIQLDWAATPGVLDTLGRDGVSSNYTFDLAPRTWEFVRDLRAGTAVFAAPAGALKCGGAPQKIAYLASDHWRREGVLSKIDVHMVLPAPKIFGVPEFATVLDKVVARYGITVHFESEVTEVDPDGRRVIVRSLTTGGESADKFDLPYDFLHFVPHQSAPDFVKRSPLSMGDANGFVEVDQYTLQHTRYPNIFSLGDASGAPNSKTGAAVRKQAPVVVENLLAVKRGRDLPAAYDGYSSCPIVTAKGKMLLAEFDYSGRPHPTIPLIDTKKERTDMWYLKRYGLPFLYWHGMLKGRA